MLEHDKPKQKYGFIQPYVFKRFLYIRFVFLQCFFYLFQYFLFLPFRSRLIRFVDRSAFFITLFPLSSLHFSAWSSSSGLEQPHAHENKTHKVENKITQNVKHACKCRLWKPHIHFSCSSNVDIIEWKRRDFNLFKVKLTVPFRWNIFDVHIALNVEIF